MNRCTCSCGCREEHSRQYTSLCRDCSVGDCVGHDPEVQLQEEDDAAYEGRLKSMSESTPEYWCTLTDMHTAKIIGPDCCCDSFTVSGVIETKDDVARCLWCNAPEPGRTCYNCGQ